MRERKLATDISKIKKADNGSITTGTTPTGKGRLKEYLNVCPKSNILNDINESMTILKNAKIAEIKGFNDCFINKDAIPPAKSKKIPAKNKITISTFGGMLKWQRK